MSSVDDDPAARISVATRLRTQERGGAGQGGDYSAHASPRALAILDTLLRQLGGGGAVDRHADAPAWVHDLRDSILTALAGGRPVVASLSSTPALEVLEQLRSAYLGVARRDRSADARPVLDVAAALDAVLVILRREAGKDVDDLLDDVGTVDAVVEVAHDMRSPLGAILMLVQMVLEREPLQEERAQQLRIVYSAAFGLNALVNDLVDSVQPEARLLESSPVRFSVADTVGAVRDIVQPVAAEKGLQLRVKMPDGELRTGHPAALQRVLLNLTTNALKYTDRGSVTLAARELSATRMEFSVSDTGRGVPQAQLATLFRPFQRGSVRSPATTFPSAGIGLALCRRLVASMGGTLSVESQEGRGTIVRVELDLPNAPARTPSLVPESWADELIGPLVPVGSAIALEGLPLRITPRAD